MSHEGEKDKKVNISELKVTGLVNTILKSSRVWNHTRINIYKTLYMKMKTKH
jgi:hypothetical protein